MEVALSNELSCLRTEQVNLFGGSKGFNLWTSSDSHQKSDFVLQEYNGFCFLSWSDFCAVFSGFLSMEAHRKIEVSRSEFALSNFDPLKHCIKCFSV